MEKWLGFAVLVNLSLPLLRDSQFRTLPVFPLKILSNSPLVFLKSLLPQVSGHDELVEVLHKLFSDAQVLKERQVAARQAFNALSGSVVGKVWNLIEFHVLRRFLC